MRISDWSSDVCSSDLLLIVAPMSGHFATLLRGTVERMLPDHDVYITDWRDARDVPVFEGTFDPDDYVDYVFEFLRFLDRKRVVYGKRVSVRVDFVGCCFI